jgi:type VI secretion system protein
MRVFGRKLVAVGFLVLWGGVLSGCGAKVATRSFAMEASVEMNDRSAVAVDAILVRDPALVGVIGAMTARSWFDEKPQMLLDHPKGFEVIAWELVPGQSVEVRYPFRTRKGHAIYLFANYMSAGAHRVRVDELQRFTILLGRDGFTTSSER